MPIGQAFKLCPQGIYLRGHFSEYSRSSKAVKSILERYAPMIEQASIDEYYMDFTGCEKIYGNWVRFAERLQAEINSELGLPCSIGIASNKTLAKIASDFMKPKGITYVMHGMEKEFIAPLPVETIPGVGKVTLKELHHRGFYTAGDVARASKDYFTMAYGKSGADLWEKTQGIGPEVLTLEREQKSISKETTFEEDVTDKSIVEKALFEMTGKVCHSLREYGWRAATIGIKLRYTDFVTLTRAKTVEPTDDDKTVYEITSELLHKNYTRRVAVRLIGIHLTKFCETADQENLFESENDKREKMLQAVTKLRDKYGFKSIDVGK
jgi:DNA polymerase-4